MALFKLLAKVARKIDKAKGEDTVLKMSTAFL